MAGSLTALCSQVSSWFLPTQLLLTGTGMPTAPISTAPVPTLVILKVITIDSRSLDQVRSTLMGKLLPSAAVMSDVVSTLPLRGVTRTGLRVLCEATSVHADVPLRRKRAWKSPRNYASLATPLSAR